MANKEVYQSAVLTAHLCAKMLAQFDIPELLEDIAKADAYGPVLDPTLYRDKMQAMQEDRQVLEAALKLRAFGVKSI